VFPDQSEDGMKLSDVMVATGGLVLLGSAAYAIDCAQVQALLQQGHSAQQIAAAAGLNVADVEACRPRQPQIISPVGPPPRGAAGPAPKGAAGPPPLGAAGPPPVGAAGPAPFGTRR
jgi:hypothetical protein